MGPLITKKFTHSSILASSAPMSLYFFYREPKLIKNWKSEIPAKVGWINPGFNHSFIHSIIHPCICIFLSFSHWPICTSLILFFPLVLHQKFSYTLSYQLLSVIYYLGNSTRTDMTFIRAANNTWYIPNKAQIYIFCIAIDLYLTCCTTVCFPQPSSTGQSECREFTSYIISKVKLYCLKGSYSYLPSYKNTIWLCCFADWLKSLKTFFYCTVYIFPWEEQCNYNSDILWRNWRANYSTYLLNDSDAAPKIATSLTPTAICLS